MTAKLTAVETTPSMSSQGTNPDEMNVGYQNWWIEGAQRSRASQVQAHPTSSSIASSTHAFRDVRTTTST
jgi:hypothetical protein